MKGARHERGWTLRELASRAGITHKAVQYWEAKPEVDTRAYAVTRIAKALGVRTGEFCDHYMRARHGVLLPDDAERLPTEVAPGMSPSLGGRITHGRVICGAKTRKGTPCRAKSEPDKLRCRFHGGMSTGPRTPEGKARIAEAQRRRWARWRAKLKTQLPQSAQRQELRLSEHLPPNAMALLRYLASS